MFIKLSLFQETSPALKNVCLRFCRLRFTNGNQLSFYHVSITYSMASFVTYVSYFNVHCSILFLAIQIFRDIKLLWNGWIFWYVKKELSSILMGYLHLELFLVIETENGEQNSAVSLDFRAWKPTSSYLYWFPEALRFV